MHVKQSEALLEELRRSKATLAEDILSWIDQQPNSLYEKTHVPMGLYATIYEGQPRRYLEGIKIVGVNRDSAFKWFSDMPTTCPIRSLFAAWLHNYDERDIELDPSSTLLITRQGVVYGDYDSEYANMQLVELLQVYRFLTSVCCSLVDTEQATMAQPTASDIHKNTKTKRRHIHFRLALPGAKLMRRLAGAAR
ncbi:hypothetical protein [Corallincola spongiicola]|uniref:Uncharacterized protein n=1 Tax=Corallincola spongiicola TaxID=2520508 RepID=A0ABY1WTR8_9GAMM|nr:hypothetical protein [Corallincola spongiicola]TAA48133.1 hypothetical protein EXY25_02515 [Corallincola spongiicola]